MVPSMCALKSAAAAADVRDNMTKSDNVKWFNIFWQLILINKYYLLYFCILKASPKLFQPFILKGRLN